MQILLLFFGLYLLKSPMSETDARGLPVVSLRKAFGSTRTSYIFDEKGVREHVEHATKCEPSIVSASKV